MWNAIKSILGSILFRSLGALSTIAFTIYTSLNLTTDQAAYWFLVLNILTAASVIGRWGLDELIVKNVAQSSKAEDIKASLTTIYALAIPRAVITITCSVALFLSITFFGELFEYQGPENLYILATFTILGMATLACVGRGFQALGRTNIAATLLTVALPASGIFFLEAASAVDKKPDHVHLLWTYLITSWTATILFTPLLRKEINKRGGKAEQNRANDREKTQPNKRAASSIANRLGFITLINQGLNWGTIATLPFFFESKAITTFIVAQKLSMSISLIGQTIAFSLSHKLAREASSNHKKELKELASKGLYAILTISAIAAIVLAINNKIVANLAGVEDPDFPKIFGLLLASQIAFGAFTFISSISIYTNNEKDVLRYTIASLALGIVGALIAGSFNSTTMLASTYLCAYAMQLILINQALRKIDA